MVYLASFVLRHVSGFFTTDGQTDKLVGTDLPQAIIGLRDHRTMATLRELNDRADQSIQHRGSPWLTGGVQRREGGDRRANA